MVRRDNHHITAFVVGSKPEATFPDAHPDVVVAANGAIARVQNYLGKAEIIGVVSNGVFRRDKESGKGTRSILTGSRVDELVTFSLQKRRHLLLDPLNVGLSFSQQQFLSRRKETALRLRYYYSKRRLIAYVWKSRGLIGILRFFLDLLRGIKPKDIKTSTGVFGVAILLERLTSPATIYLIGIGLDSGGGHFYDPGKAYDHGKQMIDSHAEKDRFFLCNLIEAGKHRIIVTDPNAHRLLSTNCVG